MSKKLNKKQIERFSRQIILKNIGILGQNKITNTKVLIIGMGGLGCPVAEFLTRSGIGSLGIVDHDRISLSNIHRQSLFNEKNLNQLKVKIAKKKLRWIRVYLSTFTNLDLRVAAVSHHRTQIKRLMARSRRRGERQERIAKNQRRGPR